MWPGSIAWWPLTVHVSAHLGSCGFLLLIGRWPLMSKALMGLRLGAEVLKNLCIMSLALYVTWVPL